MLNEGYAFRLALGPSCLGHTAFSFVVTTFLHSDQVEWQSRFDSGEMQLDESEASGAEPLKPGMILIWNRPAWHEEDTPQEYGVIHQDKHLLVVDKPSGLPTLPGAGFYANSLLSLVRRDFPQANPVHRLGRATSGLTVFALDKATASMLCKRWSNVRKQYQALGSFIAIEKVYDIRSPIGLVEHPRLGQVHAVSATGKATRSVVRTVELRADSTVFEVDLHTGRPHQIRIHLASIGHPLVGDPLYAIGGQPKAVDPGLPGDAGYWLHAKELVLIHPISGKQLQLTSPLPCILRKGETPNG